MSYFKVGSFIKCVNNFFQESSLTLNKIYQVLESENVIVLVSPYFDTPFKVLAEKSEYTQVLIYNDMKENRFYFTERFVLVTSKKHKKLIK